MTFTSSELACFFLCVCFFCWCWGLEILILLFLGRSECPKACLNFLKLCKIKYYNNHLFYKVEKDFIAQTGDPTGTGKGGESIYQKLSSNPETPKYFEDEVSLLLPASLSLTHPHPHPLSIHTPTHTFAGHPLYHTACAQIHASLRHDQLGTVAMANKGPNLNSSQFYITLTDRHLDYLDDKHTVFGIVTEGREVLEKINNAFVDDDHRPFRNIRIRHTVILDDPFEDPDNLEKLIPDASPIPTRDIHDVERLADDDDLDDRFKGLTEQEIEEQLQAKEAESRAVVLEMIGDIPDADIKPPENILFVAQLNPITTDEDLELLFSRFGTIQSCEIIRDWKTGDSLQYAFIEFASEEQCEQAYLKMNNVVVDDRRIKVDFSQSVAKLWNNHRRGIKQTADPDPSGRKP